MNIGASIIHAISRPFSATVWKCRRKVLDTSKLQAYSGGAKVTFPGVPFLNVRNSPLHQRRRIMAKKEKKKQDDAQGKVVKTLLGMLEHSNRMAVAAIGSDGALAAVVSSLLGHGTHLTDGDGQGSSSVVAPLGVCHLPSGATAILTQPQCAALGGTWKPQPVERGAKARSEAESAADELVVCQLPGGGSALLTRAQCIALGGSPTKANP
jgi:hypothetical protein